VNPTRRLVILIGLFLGATAILGFRYRGASQYRARVKSAQSYLEQGDAASALYVLRELIQSGWREAELLYLAARSYRLMGVPDKSLEYAALAAELGLESAELDMERGLALFDLGRFQEAKPILESRPTKETISALTFLHLNLFEMDEALRDLNTWTMLDPENPLPHALCGDMWVQAPDYGKAAEAFRRAVELDRDNLEVRTKLASSLRELGQLDHASRILRQCDTEEPNNPTVMLLLARCEADSGDVVAARSLLERLIDAHPNLPAALVESGKIDLENGDFESAANLLRRAVQLDPRSDSALYNLASALKRLGRDDDAAEPLNRWSAVQELRRRLRDLLDHIEEDPTDVESHAAAGAVCLELGDSAQAARHITAVLAREPDHAAARQLLARLTGTEHTDLDPALTESRE